jgi:AcrR family transcriptional regulator
MTASRVPAVASPRRRADAQRSIEAIVRAARTVLGERANASMEEIAAAAGVTRQTVYAHFPSRDALVLAVIDAVRTEGLATIAAAGLDALPPAEALHTLLTMSWELLGRSAVLLEPMLARLPRVKPEAPRSGVDLLIERIVRRGQRSGDFDRALSVDWLVRATHTLAHAAAEQVITGRLRPARAATLLETSILRLYGASGSSRAGSSRD